VLVSGVVDHKAISGVNDVISRTLLVISPDGLLIKDPALFSLLQDRRVNLTVDEKLDQKMHNLGYSKILYLVSIRVDTSDPVNGVDRGETLQYYASRDDFNGLTFDGSVAYEIDRLHGATITRALG